jgi:hypothetical protein
VSPWTQAGVWTHLAVLIPLALVLVAHLMVDHCRDLLACFLGPVAVLAVVADVLRMAGLAHTVVAAAAVCAVVAVEAGLDMHPCPRVHPVVVVVVVVVVSAPIFPADRSNHPTAHTHLGHNPGRSTAGHIDNRSPRLGDVAAAVDVLGRKIVAGVVAAGCCAAAVGMPWWRYWRSESRAIEKLRTCRGRCAAQRHAAGSMSRAPPRDM